jgi:hypothetical protein
MGERREINVGDTRNGCLTLFEKTFALSLTLSPSREETAAGND